MLKSNLHSKYLFIFFFIFSIISISFFFGSNLNKLKYNWDEADYAKVANNGFLSNYLDINSLSINQYLYIAKQKYLGEKLDKKIIKNFINEDEDNFHLRHYHPPLPVYYWSFFNFFNGESIDKNNILRLASLLLYLFFFFYILLTISKIKIKNNFDLVLIILFLLSFITNKTYINGFINLQFHIFYAFIIIYHLNSLKDLYIKEDIFRPSLNFIISTALLIITLHTSLISIFATTICIYLLNQSYKRKISITKIIKLYSLSILVAIILFPPLITKLYYGKIASVYIYKLIFLSGNEFSIYGSLFDKWSNYIINNYIVLTIPLVCVILFYFKGKKQYWYLNIFLIHAFIYAVFISPFFVSFSYILPSLMCLIIFSLKYLLLKNFYEKNILKISFLILFLLIIAFNIHLIKKSNYKDFVLEYNNRINNINLLLEKNSNKKFLIDGAHIFKQYSSNKKIDELEMLSRTSPEFYLRKDFEYVSLINEINNNYYDFIIIQKNRGYTSQQLNNLDLKNYGIIQNNFYYIFKLRK